MQHSKPEHDGLKCIHWQENYTKLIYSFILVLYSTQIGGAPRNFLRKELNLELSFFDEIKFLWESFNPSAPTLNLPLIQIFRENVTI